MAQFSVEPFNTFSNLFFLAVIIFWATQISKIKDPGFRHYLITGLPILFMGYIALAIPVILPMYLYERWKSLAGGKDLLIAFLFLVLAVSFRALDSSYFVQQNIPMGTHWPCHSFGGMTTHLVLLYMYKHTQERYEALEIHSNPSASLT